MRPPGKIGSGLYHNHDSLLPFLVSRAASAPAQVWLNHVCRNEQTIRPSGSSGIHRGAPGGSSLGPLVSLSLGTRHPLCPLHRGTGVCPGVAEFPSLSRPAEALRPAGWSPSAALPVATGDAHPSVTRRPPAPAVTHLAAGGDCLANYLPHLPEAGAPQGVCGGWARIPDF